MTLREGLALRYRRTAQGFGVWYARIVLPEGNASEPRIGMADDYADSDGVTALTYYEAQDKARELAAHRPPPAYTVGAAIDDYLVWYREHRKAVSATESTIKAHIRPQLGELNVAELTTVELKAWRDRLARSRARTRTGKGQQQRHKAERASDAERDEAKRARRATANRVLAVLKAILNKAFEDERVPDDSAWRRVKPFEKVDLPRVRFLTAPEAVRLVNSSDPDFRSLVRAALLTGARYGELAGMLVGAFNTTTGQLYVAPSKSGRSRYVPLNAAGVELFRHLTAGRKAGELMFRRGGGAWGKNYQQRPLVEACKRAKIIPSLRFHELRHTYASALAQAGADLLTISKLLGHADTRVTARHYAHLCDRTLANAVNRHLPDFGSVEPGNVESIAR